MTTPTNAELSKFLDAQQSDNYSTRLLFQLAAKRLRAADKLADKIDALTFAGGWVSKTDDDWKDLDAALTAYRGESQ